VRAAAPAVIVGAYEHPLRKIPDRSIHSVVTDVAYGALADAGLTPDQVDGFFFAGTHQGVSLVSMADHLGLGPLSYVESTDLGGASYLTQVGHAAMAVASGRCSVALVAMAGLPLSRPVRSTSSSPQADFEEIYGLTQPAGYALAAMRHMHDHGTTSEQLAAVRVAASHHAQFNPHALRRAPVTVDEVLESPMISDPLHRLDCCVTTDGGGAVVVVAASLARELGRRSVTIRGQAESAHISGAGPVDLSQTAAAVSGPLAFEAAGLTPGDIDMVSLYDSFTITVLLSLEDLGFCPKGQSGRFVEDGALLAPYGALPFNTDGGGLCNNHPDRRGGMIRMIEAVRQLREEATPETQVPDCEFALVQGHGHSLGTRSASSTLILGRADT
jgi:acetyl-CoA C-acetyltransferase